MLSTNTVLSRYILQTNNSIFATVTAVFTKAPLINARGNALFYFLFPFISIFDMRTRLCVTMTLDGNMQIS